MKVEVKLYANFQEYLPPGSERYSCTLELQEGTSIAQVLARLRIPESLPMVALVNGIHRKLEDPLQPGDVLSIFPPVAGGATVCVTFEERPTRPSKTNPISKVGIPRMVV
jgi:molybdopterin converting factor small subunit